MIFLIPFSRDIIKISEEDYAEFYDVDNEEEPGLYIFPYLGIIYLIRIFYLLQFVDFSEWEVKISLINILKEDENMKDIFNWLSSQSQIEILMASYSGTITIYMFVVAMLRKVKSKNFILRHKALLYGITYFIAGIFVTASFFVTDMLIPYIPYQAAILISAFFANTVCISGVSIKKIKDIEFGSEDVDYIKEYVISQDKASAYLRDFIVTMDRLSSTHRNSIQRSNFVKFNAEYSSYIHEYKDMRSIKSLEFIDLDVPYSNKIVQNYINNLVKSRGLWYNKDDIKLQVQKLIESQKSVELTNNLWLIPVRNRRHYALVVIEASSSLYDFDEQFIVSSYISFFDML